MNSILKDAEVSEALAKLRAAVEKAMVNVEPSANVMAKSGPKKGVRVKTSMFFLEIEDEAGAIQASIDIGCCPCLYCAAATVNEITGMFEDIVNKGNENGARGLKH